MSSSLMMQQRFPLLPAASHAPLLYQTNFCKNAKMAWLPPFQQMPRGARPL
jgi:hypothetical protein